MTKSSPSHRIATCRRYSMQPFTAFTPPVYSPLIRGQGRLPRSSTALCRRDHPGSVPFSSGIHRPRGDRPESARSPAGSQAVIGWKPGGDRMVTGWSRVHRRFICAPIYWRYGRLGGPRFASLAMKTPLWIALTLVVVLGAGSGLAVLNQACKTGHHTWCAPDSGIRHHAKAGT
jgi:hypothetical protein